MLYRFLDRQKVLTGESLTDDSTKRHGNDFNTDARHTKILISARQLPIKTLEKASALTHSTPTKTPTQLNSTDSSIIQLTPVQFPTVHTKHKTPKLHKLTIIIQTILQNIHNLSKMSKQNSTFSHSK